MESPACPAGLLVSQMLTTVTSCSYVQSLSLRLIIPARPIRPVPSSPSEPGSGRAATRARLGACKVLVKGVVELKEMLNLTTPPAGPMPGAELGARVPVSTALSRFFIIVPETVSVNKTDVPAAFLTVTVALVNVQVPLAPLHPVPVSVPKIII